MRWNIQPVYDTPGEGAPAPVVAPPWHAGSEPEFVGYLQNRNWHDKPAADVAKLAITAHREAEKLIGVPANRVVRLPENMDDSVAMRDVFKRLGMPADAKDYDFAAVKHAGDKPLDAKLDAALRQAAYDANLPKNAAQRVASALVKHLDEGASAAQAEATANLATEKEALAKNWGTNAVANRLIAQNAAKALGIDEGTVAALEKVAGYAKVMDMFRQIGVKIGEDKYLGGGTPNGGNGITTREQALARKAELSADAAWRGRYLAGDTVAKREMLDLNTIIGGAVN